MRLAVDIVYPVMVGSVSEIDNHREWILETLWGSNPNSLPESILSFVFCCYLLLLLLFLLFALVCKI